MRKIFLLVVLVLLAGTAQAQVGERDGEQMSQFNVLWAQPEGELVEQIDTTPVGASFLFGGRVPGSPLYLGSELGFLTYGSQERLDLHRIEELPVHAATTSISQNIFMGHLVARLQVPVGPIRPFIEGLAGLKYFVGRSTIRSDVLVFPDGLEASAHVSDWALSYGAGGGLDIQFYQGTFGIYDHPGTVSLTLGARYLYGPRATFVTEGFFDEERGVFDFETTRTVTDLLLTQIGVRFSL